MFIISIISIIYVPNVCLGQEGEVIQDILQPHHLHLAHSGREFRWQLRMRDGAGHLILNCIILSCFSAPCNKIWARAGQYLVLKYLIDPPKPNKDLLVAET